MKILQVVILTAILTLLCSCSTTGKWEMHNYTNTYVDNDCKPYQESVTLLLNTETGETRELIWSKDKQNYWQKITTK